MIRITLELDEIDYDALLAQYLPQARAALRNHPLGGLLERDATGRLAGKLGLFSLAIAAMLALLYMQTGIWPEEDWALSLLLLALGLVCFLLYDRALHVLELAYRRKLEPRLFP